MVFLTGQRGQVIVQLALLMVVLLGFVALAVDFGHIYAERRKMQNAADAGALAGARELCFGDPGLAEARAREYAITQNGAQDAGVSIVDYVVTVTATETTDTYLAGIVGLRTVYVPAVAAAACGKATSSCGLWPIAFKYGDWVLADCGRDYLLWEEGRADCETYDCDVDGDGADEDLALDERTWVDFSAVLADGQPDPCDSSGCGADELRDRIDGYDKITDVPCRSWVEIPSCTAGDSGVIDVAWRDAGDEAGEIKLIPLYDSTGCVMEHDPGNACSNERYRVVDVGCVKVMGAVRLCERDRPQQCHKRVIWVQVSCDGQECASECGTTGGGPPGPGDVRAVSLIR